MRIGSVEASPPLLSAWLGVAGSSLIPQKVSSASDDHTRDAAHPRIPVTKIGKTPDVRAAGQG
jgi:hypothetical protein